VYSNTSHVTINRGHTAAVNRSDCIQIHLMLLLIRLSFRPYRNSADIQIHLMLLLILSRFLYPANQLYSNTSHVTINLVNSP